MKKKCRFGEKRQDIYLKKGAKKNSRYYYMHDAITTQKRAKRSIYMRQLKRAKKDQSPGYSPTILYDPKANQKAKVALGFLDES